MAIRLIALDRCPGVRPIGVGEVSRTIMSKAILSIMRSDIQNTHSLQLCVGQKSGCGAAIHALDALFDEGTTEGILLVDASNVLNNLNRQATLMNGQKLYPVFAAALVNTYWLEPSLFIDGETILSRQGTTQVAMAMYANGILPLILHLLYSILLTDLVC